MVLHLHLIPSNLCMDIIVSVVMDTPPMSSFCSNSFKFWYIRVELRLQMAFLSIFRWVRARTYDPGTESFRNISWFPSNCKLLWLQNIHAAYIHGPMSSKICFFSSPFCQTLWCYLTDTFAWCFTYSCGGHLLRPLSALRHHRSGNPQDELRLRGSGHFCLRHNSRWLLWDVLHTLSGFYVVQRGQTMWWWVHVMDCYTIPHTYNRGLDTFSRCNDNIWTLTRYVYNSWYGQNGLIK